MIERKRQTVINMERGGKERRRGRGGKEELK